MLKVIGGVALLAFAGGAIYALLKEPKPELLEEIENRTRSTARSLVEAFKEGYRSGEPV